MKINLTKSVVSSLVMTGLFFLSFRAEAGSLSGSIQIGSASTNTMTSSVDSSASNLINLYPQINGSYILYVIRYCTPGSTWNKKNEGVTWDMTKSFIVPPQCYEVSWGYYGSLKSSYSIQIPDIKALYGLDSLNYTVYFEARIPFGVGTKSVLLDSKVFQVVAQ